MDNIWIAAGLAAVLSYLIGSINFPIILSRVLCKDDVRKHGSGNAGMTNIMRTYGKWIGILALIGDSGKGTLCYLLARWLTAALAPGREALWCVLAAGLCGMLGHIYPIYFGFKGGKAVLFIAGYVVLYDPLTFCLCFAVFLVVLAVWRMVSLASVVMAVSFPIVTALTHGLLGGEMPVSILFAALACLIVTVKHAPNLKRIAEGTEYKIGERSRY